MTGIHFKSTSAEVVVSSLCSHTSAFTQGMREGDQLLQLNGCAVYDTESFVQACARLRKGDVLTLILREKLQAKWGRAYEVVLKASKAET